MEPAVAVAIGCGYIHGVHVATSQVEVGVRDLKNNLSRYLDRVRQGEDVIVTERGKPVARLSALDHPTDRLAALIAAGAVRPPKRTTRHRPPRRITPAGPVSDLVAEQRR
jgi:prevent-host-death family protein